MPLRTDLGPTDLGRAIPQSASPTGDGAPRVLVVDDDAVVRDVVARYLIHGGYAVEEAANGSEAQARIVAEPPDLVILDVMMPAIDGLELCRWIRRSPGSSQVPVILLTARGEESDRIVGLELGADDYVVKPFSARELVGRVRAILRRVGPGQAPEPTQLAVGELSIDSTTREVTREGELIALTPTEFDLLWCLARYPRVVFTREQLLAKVWKYDAALDAGTSTVTVHIRRLREKLERDPSAPRYITTVWGVGYRFEP